MTATATVTAEWTPMGSYSGVPTVLHIPLGASAQVGRGQWASVDSSGNTALNDGTTPNLMPAGVGYPAVLSGTSTTAGSAAEDYWIGFSSAPMSSVANDSFTNADMGVPAWIYSENAVGKLSNYSTSNRSLAGLAFGLVPGASSLVRVWSGPVAGLLARATLITQAKVGAWYTLADAAANTTTSEVAIHREKLHGVVTAVQFTGDAVAADNTDYVTITIGKRDGAGGSSSTVATYDSRSANQGAITQHVPASFVLSGTAANLNLLETDILTITVAKGGSGKSLRGAVRVIQKVI